MIASSELNATTITIEMVMGTMNVRLSYVLGNRCTCHRSIVMTVNKYFYDSGKQLP